MSILGKKVKIIIDRPLGSYHPIHKDLYYPVNYGYVEGVMAADDEEQDAYLLGVNHAVEEYEAVIIAIIKRKNDIEDKWICAPSGTILSVSDILEMTYFQEQYFEIEIIT